MQAQTQETLYLIVTGRLSLASQVLVIDKLPATVGRSIHCDITLNDPTIAPVQLLIDRDETGAIFIVDQATASDNPTKFQGKALPHRLVVNNANIRLTAGRLTFRLTSEKEHLSKTIQLRPPGLLGLMTSPITAVFLLLMLFGVWWYEAQLDSIKPFELNYSALFEFAMQLLLYVVYCIIIHLMFARFSLALLSLSVLTLLTLGQQLLPFMFDQFEYALNITSENLLYNLVYMVLALLLWFVVLRQKLHLPKRKALVHTVLVCLPLLVMTFSEVVIQGFAAQDHTITGKFNGQLEPYNWHVGKTQSLQAFFAEASQQLIQAIPAEQSN